jgi:hypothetical protein
MNCVTMIDRSSKSAGAWDQLIAANVPNREKAGDEPTEHDEWNDCMW